MHSDMIYRHSLEGHIPDGLEFAKKLRSLDLGSPGRMKMLKGMDREDYYFRGLFEEWLVKGYRAVYGDKINPFEEPLMRETFGCKLLPSGADMVLAKPEKKMDDEVVVNSARDDCSEYFRFVVNRLGFKPKATPIMITRVDQVQYPLSLEENIKKLSASALLGD